MVLTAPRLGVLLGACGAITALAGAPHRLAAQEPSPAPAPTAPPPRTPRNPAWYDGGRLSVAADSAMLREAWIGIGLACSRCSFQSAGKTVRRWSFSEPPAITMVDHDGPADRVGLRGGDTLVAVDGQTLVSPEGGEAFANLRPGVAVRLTYRRDGRERTASVTPAENPLSAQVAVADSQYRAAMRAYERGAVEAQRELQRTQGERQRAQRDLQRALEDMQRNRGKVLDSVSTQRMHEALEQAQRALEVQRSYAFTMPAYPRVAPVPPAAPVPPVVSTGIPAPGYGVAARGSLRYAGRLGEAVIEARRPGRVTVVETGDSEVVLTGGDLSVRVALSAPVVVGRAAAGVSAGFATARSASGDESAGIQGVVANPRLAVALGAVSGVLVLDVLQSSHADSLGIRPGDVLVSLDGHPVVSIESARETPKRLRAATTARSTARSAVVVRARERRTLTLAEPAASRPRLQAPGNRPPRSP